MCYDSTFRTEPFNMLRFTFHKMLRNQQGERCINMTCFFEHSVQTGLHSFPNCKTGRSDYHASFNRCIISKLPGRNYIKIPLRVIFFAGCNVFCHFGRYLSGKTKGGSIPSFNGEMFAGMNGLCWIEHSKIQILQHIYKANLKCRKQS